MGNETTIPWCHHTFNGWWGCTKVSEECKNCYAETWDKRWGGANWGPDSARRFFGLAHWQDPLGWNRTAEREKVRKRVFCGSMKDILEDRRDLDPLRAKVWALIERTEWLDWLLLTKRPENFLRMLPAHWLKSPRHNVWVLTTAGLQKHLSERVGHLIQVPAVVRGLSCEPMLGPMDFRGTLHQKLIDWAIFGGESGDKASQCHIEWIRAGVKQCRDAGVSPFVKQLGANPVMYRQTILNEGESLADIIPVHSFTTGKALLDKKGEDMTEWPADLHIREIPTPRVCA